MPRNGPVVDLRRPLADHEHRVDEPALPPPGLALGLADRPAGPQALRELAAQLAAPLQVEGLVDRLVADVHRLILRVLPGQVSADLLWAPLQPAQTVLDRREQGRVGGELALLGTWSARRSPAVRGMRPVVTAAWMSVARQLPADRARRPPELGGDVADTSTRTVQISDDHPLVLAEVPGTDRRRRAQARGHDLRATGIDPIARAGLADPTPPIPTGPDVDPHRLRGPLHAHPGSQQRQEPLPVQAQWPCPRGGTATALITTALLARILVRHRNP